MITMENVKAEQLRDDARKLLKVTSSFGTLFIMLSIIYLLQTLYCYFSIDPERHELVGEDNDIEI